MADTVPRERTPWLLGFLCILIPLMPAYVVIAGPLKSNGSPARIIAVLMFCLVILGFLLTRRSSVRRQINPGLLILLGYFFLLLLTYGIGALFIDNPIIMANRTRAILTLIADIGIGLYAMTRVQTSRQRTFILGCLAIGLSYACFVAVLQGLAATDLRLLIKPPGFVLNVDDLKLDERQGAKRVLGTSQHAIEFSVLAAVTVPLTIYFARHALTRNRRLLSAAACVLAILAMPAAISRSGVISLSTALLVYMLAFKVRQIGLALLVVAIAIGMYAMAFPTILSALWNTITGSQNDPSIQARTEDYAGVSQIFRDHPVFGLGLGGQPRLLDNQWLQTVVQGGLVGVAAMIVITFAALLGISAALRCATSIREREQAYMLGAVISGILVSSTTFDLFYYQQVTLVFFIVYGLLWGPYAVALPNVNRATGALVEVPART
jgi:O-antigen ligase